MNEDGISPNGENLSASSARWIRSAMGLSRSEIWSLANLGPRGRVPRPRGGGSKNPSFWTPPRGGYFQTLGGSKKEAKNRVFYPPFLPPPPFLSKAD